MTNRGRVKAHRITRVPVIFYSLHLVPKFNEREIEVFFSLFERLADARGWVDFHCTILLHFVFTGRAQEALSSSSAADSAVYAKVKGVVLKAYELVPEEYRQRFRNWEKRDGSFLEYARDLGTHFTRWCAASGVDDFDDLCNLMVLEQFRNSVPDKIAMYISEQKVKTAAEAAALADEYWLTHKGMDSRAHHLGSDRENGQAGYFSGPSGGGFVPG